MKLNKGDLAKLATWFFVGATVYLQAHETVKKHLDTTQPKEALTTKPAKAVAAVTPKRKGWPFFVNLLMFELVTFGGGALLILLLHGWR